MFDYRLLETLAAVVESEGFERASRQLHVTQSAVSQRLSALEQQLGHPLVERTPVNADSLGFWMVDAITPLLTEESLLVDIVVADQEQTLNFLRRGEVVGAISAVDTPVTGCASHPLGSMVYRARATHAFKDRWFPRGFRKDSARKAPAITFNRDDQLQSRLLEGIGLSAGEYPTHYVPDTQMFFELCRRGAGYAMLPELQVRQRGAEGELVDLAPRRAIRVPLYFHHWNVETRLVRSLIAAMQDAEGLEALTPLTNGKSGFDSP